MQYVHGEWWEFIWNNETITLFKWSNVAFLVDINELYQKNAIYAMVNDARDLRKMNKILGQNLGYDNDIFPNF